MPPPRFCGRSWRARFDRFPCRDHDQNSPEVVPIRELGKAALLGTTTEAAKRTQGDSFLTSRRPWRIAEFRACKPHQLSKVTLPQFLGRRTVSGLELLHPITDRRERGHAKTCPMMQ
jgi:hypothetical protein